MTTEFNTTEDINSKYNFYYNPRELTPLEKTIINSNNINLNSYNLNDLDTVKALSIYYDIQVAKEPCFENESLLVAMLLKIVKLGDSDVGHLRLGLYYYHKNNKEKAEEHYLLCNLPEAKCNLYLLYQDRVQLLEDAFNSGYTNCAFMIGSHYFLNDNLNESIKYFEYGLYKKCRKSLESLQVIFDDQSVLYVYLNNLSFNNELIEMKIRELSPKIDQKVIDICRGKNMVYMNDDNNFGISGYSRELIEKFP